MGNGDDLQGFLIEKIDLPGPGLASDLVSTRKATARPYISPRLQAGLEGIISKRKGSPYRSGRSPDWLKTKNADAPAVKREEEEDRGRHKWR